jgi:hypothetical protein
MMENYQSNETFDLQFDFLLLVFAAGPMYVDVRVVAAGIQQGRTGEQSLRLCPAFTVLALVNVINYCELILYTG